MNELLARYQRRIEALAERRAQVEARAALAMRADAKEGLETQLRELDLEIGRTMARWFRAGGTVTLGLAPLPEVSWPALPPPTMIPPDDDPTETDAPAVESPAVESRAVDSDVTAETEPPGAAVPERAAPVPEEPEELPLGLVALPPPAEKVELERLKDHLEGAGGFVDEEDIPTPAGEWLPQLAAIVSSIPPARSINDELDGLADATRHIADWVTLPKLVQVDLIGHVTARMRHLQDDEGVDDPALDRAFKTITAYSAREQPGFVVGLSRSHQPLRGSWEDDAEAYLDRLQTVLAPREKLNVEKLLRRLEESVSELSICPPAARSAVMTQALRRLREALEGGVRVRDPRLLRLAEPIEDRLGDRVFKSLRKALRDQQAGDDDSSEMERPIPDDWPWWSFTRGRQAVLVGGSPREPNRARLEEVFGFAELEWIAHEKGNKNNLIRVRDRVRAGKLDLVVILGAFVGHDADRVILPACRDMGTAWVHVDHGYGVVRLRHAIERFLDPR